MKQERSKKIRWVKRILRLTIDLLRKIKPQQVFCAGDFADPHGTHIVCFNIVLGSIETNARLPVTNGSRIAGSGCIKAPGRNGILTEIEMAIPMSPDQVLKKRFGIFIHQSQKDMVPFQGSDSREFWQRAEERNTNTANLYAQLGLTHYAAMEAFVRWHY